MAKFTLTTLNEYRPCMINGKNALFHRWAENCYPVNESPLVGGHPAGFIKEVSGIVEFENGDIEQVSPNEITFVDGKLSEYVFYTDKTGGNSSNESEQKKTN